jgi:hypothetical protein
LTAALQHDPVHVRAGGPQQMVLRVVEHRERVGAVRGPGAAQPPGETVQHVLLTVLERPHLPGPVEEHGLIVTARARGQQALDHAARRGPLDERARGLLRHAGPEASG